MLFLEDTGDARVGLLGEYAFYGCTGMTELSIPGDDVVIGKSAFSECSGLESVSFTGHGCRIGSNAFYRCQVLADLDLSGASAIGAKAFSYCRGLSSLTVAGGIGTVGDYAFYGCSGLQALMIENGVKWIGRSAFSECRSIEDVSIPASVTSIGQNAFHGIKIYSQKGSAISSTAHNMSGYEFYGTDGMLFRLGKMADGEYFVADGIAYKYVSVTKGTVSAIGFVHGSCPVKLSSTVDFMGKEWKVKSVVRYAFSGCGSLKVLDLSGVTSIGQYAFSYCTAITSIVFSKNLSTVGYNAFQGIQFYDNGKTIWADASNLAGCYFLGYRGSMHLVS